VTAEPARELTRTLRLGEVFGLAFGAILGAGWIVGLGQWLGEAGPYGALIGMSGGALVMTLVALCYTEAGSMYPSSGGEVDYAERFFGRTAGHCAGWLLALTYVCAAAFEAISIGWLCEALNPSLQTWIIYSVFGVGISAAALCIGAATVIMAGVVNYRGGRTIGRIQGLLTMTLCTAAIIFVGTAFAKGDGAYLAPHFARSASGSVLPGIVAVFITAPFWFSGFGVVSYSIGEIRPRTPLKGVAAVVVAAVFASLAFYAATLFATALTLPREQLLNLDLPASSAFRVALGSAWLARLVLLTGIVALLMALNALLFAASRVLFQLSRSGMLQPAIGHVHPTFGSPHRAVIVCTTLVVAAIFLGRGAAGSLVDICAVCISCVYVIICAGVARARWNVPHVERPFRIPGGPFIPILATILTTAMIVAAIIPLLDDWRQLIFQASVVVAWIAAGLVIHRLRSPKRRPPTGPRR
jgi:APA family basic amino acid/polyamine antiporter